jgi:N-formylglutamate amidohydrolase
VLGDRFGAACAPRIVQAADDALRKLGFKVARNMPYAGGYATERHGRPAHASHALQIEINRALYMVEAAMTPRPAFQAVREALGEVVRAVIEAGEALGAGRGAGR